MEIVYRRENQRIPVELMVCKPGFGITQGRMESGNEDEVAAGTFFGETDAA
jgi:hypothetical protein